MPIIQWIIVEHQLTIELSLTFSIFRNTSTNTHRKSLQGFEVWKRKLWCLHREIRRGYGESFARLWVSFQTSQKTIWKKKCYTSKNMWRIHNFNVICLNSGYTSSDTLSISSNFILNSVKKWNFKYEHNFWPETNFSKQSLNSKFGESLIKIS